MVCLSRMISSSCLPDIEFQGVGLWMPKPRKSKANQDKSVTLCVSPVFSNILCLNCWLTWFYLLALASVSVSEKMLLFTGNRILNWHWLLIWGCLWFTNKPSGHRQLSSIVKDLGSFTVFSILDFHSHICHPEVTGELPQLWVWHNYSREKGGKSGAPTASVTWGSKRFSRKLLADVSLDFASHF